MKRFLGLMFAGIIAATSVVVAQNQSTPLEVNADVRTDALLYEVQANDTWFGIARRFNLTANQLALQNRTNINFVLQPGMGLIVFPGSPTTTTTTSTTIPETTTTVPDTTTITSTSTTTTTTTTTTTLPTTTTTTPPGSGFTADFTTSEEFALQFETDVHFRDNDYDETASFHGDHDENCGSPNTSRTVHLDNDDNDQVFWWCGPGGPDTGHVMTAMGPAEFGYSIVTFKPKQSFTGVDKVCIDVNNTELGGDIWWEMSILLKDEFDQHPPGGSDKRMDYVTALARDIDQTALSFPDSSFVFQINDNKIRAYQGMEELIFDWFRWSTTDRAQRFTHCMVDNHNGTVTMTREVGVANQDTPGGVRTVTVPASFPQGETVVLFQQSIYDPPKHGSGPDQTTLHWDKVLVE